jgi:hypothetical protein
MDITTITFVISIVAIGLLLTATIRRDFIKRKRLRRNIQRETDHLRARSRTSGSP